MFSARNFIVLWKILIAPRQLFHVSVYLIVQIRSFKNIYKIVNVAGNMLKRN